MRATLPQVTANRPLTDIDRFVLAELEKRGLKPVALASRRDWIRRATFDLTGLPPTPEEVEAFEKDESPEAYEKLVDRGSKNYWPQWSADGKSLFFMSDRSGSENIWTKPLAGATKAVTTFTSGRVLFPDISADGKTSGYADPATVQGLKFWTDLIAAGHPRLNFEFSSALAKYPAHWRVDGEQARYPDLGWRAWQVGQVLLIGRSHRAYSHLG